MDGSKSFRISDFNCCGFLLEFYREAFLTKILALCCRYLVVTNMLAVIRFILIIVL